MKHERLGRLVTDVDRVHPLLIGDRTERRDTQRLRLAACEERRAVRPRQQAGLAADLPDLVEAATVYSDALIEDLTAHRLLLDRSQHAAHMRHFLSVLLFERPLDLITQSPEDRLPFGLVGDAESLFDTGRCKTLDRRLQALRQLDHVVLELLEGTPGHLDELTLETDQLAHGVVGQVQPFDELLLGDLERGTFDHHDRVLGAGHDDVHVGELELLEGGVDDPFVLNPADPDSGDRSLPRDRREQDRRGRAEHAPHVGVVLLVRRDHEARDLRLVAVVLREERAERTIDLASRNRGLVAGASLALDEAARELAGGVRLLPILDGEREERKVRALSLRHRGHEYRRFPKLNKNGAVCLPCHPARLHDERASGELFFDSVHWFSLS